MKLNHSRNQDINKLILFKHEDQQPQRTYKWSAVPVIHLYSYAFTPQMVWRVNLSIFFLVKQTLKLLNPRTKNKAEINLNSQKWTDLTDSSSEVKLKML